MISELKEWLGAVATLVSLATLLFTVVTRSGKEALEKVAALDLRLTNAVVERDKKIDAVEDRISRVEGELNGMPDLKSFHDLQLEMVAMRGTMEVLTERLKPLAAISERLQDFLVDQAKAK